MAEAEQKTKKKKRGAAAGKNTVRKKRRRKNRALYYIILLIILLSCGIALSFTVFFKVEAIEITGEEKYTAEDIIGESGIVTGESLLTLDTEAVGARLASEFPYLDSVRVRRRLPNTVYIDVTICEAAGALSYGDEYLLITRSGKVLERGIVYIPENVPVIKGVDAGDVKPGEILRMTRDEEAKAEQRIKQIDMLLLNRDESAEAGELALLEREKDELERATRRSRSVTEAMIMLEYLFVAIDETGFREITNVDVSDPYNMKIVFENRLLLNLGTESGLPAKLTFLKEMIEGQLPSDAEGLINATNVENRSIVFSAMPIEDAVEGNRKSRGNTIYGGEPLDKPESEAVDEANENTDGGDKNESS